MRTHWCQQCGAEMPYPETMDELFGSAKAAECWCEACYQANLHRPGRSPSAPARETQATTLPDRPADCPCAHPDCTVDANADVWDHHDSDGRSRNYCSLHHPNGK